MTRVFIRTYGCSVNRSDTEVMVGLLSEQGYEMVGREQDAEVIVINTCAVKQPTEKNFYRYLKSIRCLHKPLVIAGCIAQSMPEQLQGYSVIGTDNIADIAQVIEETMHHNPVTHIGREKSARLNLPHIRKNPVVEIIPICHGCLGNCSYCIVRHARGEFYSYPEKEILKQARFAVSQGAREIWLTAQDTGCYGKDTGTFLPALLRKVAALPGDFMVRVGMMNPEHMQDMAEDIIDCFMNDKMFRFLHIPVQSGSDKILKKMCRKYTASQYSQIVSDIRKSVPEITIASDMICGYPGETGRDFEESMDLIRTTRPDVLNISRFGPRPNTKAGKLKQLKGGTVKERSRKMTILFEEQALNGNREWIGWKGSAIVDERGKMNTWVARNRSYKPIILSDEYNLGDIVEVEVRDATCFDLRARPCPSSQGYPSSS